MNKEIYFFLSCLFVVSFSGRCRAADEIPTTELYLFSEDDKYHAVSFTYNIDGKQYIYEQRKDTKWSIRELSVNGKISSVEVAQGSLDSFYDVQFPFSIGGKHYFFGHTKSEGLAWFIRELLPDGKMGEQRHSGNWKAFQRNVFTITIDDKLYLRTSNDVTWDTWQLVRGGYIGDKVGTGKSFGFEVSFPFSVDLIQYIYYQRISNGHWFIQELLPAGKLGKETDEHFWNYLYEVQFPFSIGTNQYFYAHTAAGPWFIRQLLPGGKMGDLKDQGNWDGSFLIQFPFEIDGKQYLYAKSTENGTSFVRTILSNATIGEELNRNIWSF